MSKKVADIIVETLQSAGVKHCYGVVGDTLNQIAHSHFAESEIEWVAYDATKRPGRSPRRRKRWCRSLHRGRRKLRSRQPAFHQWHIRGQPQPRARHPDRQPNRSRRIGVRFHPGGRLQGRSTGSCSVYCDMIYTPEQARRKTVIACQTAMAKRGVAVLIVPADISASSPWTMLPYAPHVPTGRSSERCRSRGDRRNSQRQREDRHLWRVRLSRRA